MGRMSFPLPVLYGERSIPKQSGVGRGLRPPFIRRAALLRAVFSPHPFVGASRARAARAGRRKPGRRDTFHAGKLHCSRATIARVGSLPHWIAPFTVGPASAVKRLGISSREAFIPRVTPYGARSAREACAARATHNLRRFERLRTVLPRPSMPTFLSALPISIPAIARKLAPIEGTAARRSARGRLPEASRYPWLRTTNSGRRTLPSSSDASRERPLEEKVIGI